MQENGRVITVKSSSALGPYKADKQNFNKWIRVCFIGWFRDILPSSGCHGILMPELLHVLLRFTQVGIQVMPSPKANLLVAPQSFRLTGTVAG